MAKETSIWYRLGYAVEAARARSPRGDGHRTAVELSEPARKALETVLALGAGSAAARVLAFWPRRHRPGPLRILRGAAAGAAAGVLTELLRTGLAGGTARISEEEVTDVLLSGAGRGLLYATVVEPRVPGPSPLQGAVYGAAEYAVSPWGGLQAVAGPVAPHTRHPALAVLFRSRDTDASLLTHLAFGVALALLYRR